MDKNKMQRNDLFHFHKGFYLNDDVKNSLNTVKNKHYSEIHCVDEFAMDYLYTDAGVFLHGSCQLFALALYEEFGYEIYEIRNIDDIMVHVFCKSTYRGQDVYIDIRGVTTSCVDCFSEFSGDLRRGYYITKRNIEEDRGLDDEGEETGYSFAQAIVREYHTYYDVTM